MLLVVSSRMFRRIRSVDSNSNWRKEYPKMKRLSLREMELLKNGPDSLASAWRLQAMYKNYEKLKDETGATNN